MSSCQRFAGQQFSFDKNIQKLLYYYERVICAERVRESDKEWLEERVEGRAISGQSKKTRAGGATPREWLI